MASSDLATAMSAQVFDGNHVGWADLRFPPINLWIMPVWIAAGPPPRRRYRCSRMDPGTQDRMRRLLMARGGAHAAIDPRMEQRSAIIPKPSEKRAAMLDMTALRTREDDHDHQD